jgi:hypothetical protein
VTRRNLFVAVAAAISVGCGQDSISVSVKPGADYNRGKLMASIDRFVASGKTADGFATLVKEVETLRPGMDESVADEAELKLVILALVPVERALTGNAEDPAHLATRVWPFALRPTFSASSPSDPDQRRTIELWPLPSEDPASYVVRICGGILALRCGSVVPEYQLPVVTVHAVTELTRRARNAVTSCIRCESEPAWAQAVARWEQLEQKHSAQLFALESAGAVDNWPAAGAASIPWTPIPVVALEEDGDILVDGQACAPGDRSRVLRELAKDGAIGVHAPSELTVGPLRRFLQAARSAGLSRVLLVARADAYPWTRMLYSLGVGNGIPVVARDVDTVQVLVRTIDGGSRAGQTVRLTR